MRDAIDKTSNIERLNVNLSFVICSDPSQTFRTLLMYDKENLGVHIRNIITGLSNWLKTMEEFLIEKKEIGKAHSVPPVCVCFQPSEKATHFALTLRSENKEPISDFAFFFIITSWLNDLKKLVPGAVNGRS